jgi:rod shape determining protein RodA
MLLLAAVGLVAMYSAGYDHGTRFVDHGRNMLLALAVLFVVAQVPPQKLQRWRCRCTWRAWRCWWPRRCFGITKKGATRWLALGMVIQPSEILKIAMPLMLAWWFQKREGQLRVLPTSSSPRCCCCCRWRWWPSSPTSAPRC